MTNSLAAAHNVPSIRDEHHLLTASLLVGIIQRSGIGPATYIVNAADFHSVTHGNQMVKFADDAYIIIPAVNANSREAELSNGEA